MQQSATGSSAGLLSEGMPSVLANEVVRGGGAASGTGAAPVIDGTPMANPIDPGGERGGGRKAKDHRYSEDEPLHTFPSFSFVCL